MKSQAGLKKALFYLLIVALIVTMTPATAFGAAIGTPMIGEEMAQEPDLKGTLRAEEDPYENLAKLREKPSVINQAPVLVQKNGIANQTLSQNQGMPDVPVNELGRDFPYNLWGEYEFGSGGQWFAFRSDINAIYTLTLDIDSGNQDLELFVFDENLQMLDVDLHNVRDYRIQGDIPFTKDAVYYVFFQPNYDDEYDWRFAYEIKVNYSSSLPGDEPMGIPQNLSVTNKTASTATIAWDACPGAASYEVSYNGAITTTTTTSTTVTGLSPSTTYTVKVRGKNGTVVGAWSDPFVFETMQASISVPQNVAASNITSTSVTISWSASTDATGYEISYNGTITTATATSKALTGLSPNTTYTVKVRGKNGANLGAWSEPFVFETMQAPISTPQNIAASNITSTSATINWSASTNATGYEISCNDTITTATATSTTLTGLSPNTTYTVKVRGKNGTNLGTWSDPFVFETMQAPISTPQNIAASNITSTSVIISWSASTDATGYEISCNDTITTSTATGTTLTGLAPNTTYTIKVRGTNGTNLGAWSEPIIVTTPGTVIQSNVNITVQNGTDYLVSLNADGIQNTNTTYTFTYDAQKLTLVDFAGQTVNIDIAVGAVQGTNITITSVSEGKVIFKVDRDISAGNTWNGVLTIVKLKGRENGNATVTLEN